MVTAPVNKEGITLSGEKFTGHTEYIAELCGAPDSRMLLVNDRLRVVHVSTHIPLRQACELDSGRIQRTIELGHQAMRWLGFKQPRIAVCGLNPHAGESGLFGEEDREISRHAVTAARMLGMQCAGPLPADTLFVKAVRGEYDLVVAMYHDQGHIPVKLLGFSVDPETGTWEALSGVNVTLGLPIVRASVDHGTAFAIAGQGIANERSLIEALDDLGDPGRYSPEGFRRMRALGGELRGLRRRLSAPLAELVADVERVIGVDIEVAARAGVTAAAQAVEEADPPRFGARVRKKTRQSFVRLHHGIEADDRLQDRRTFAAAVRVGADIGRQH